VPPHPSRPGTRYFRLNSRVLGAYLTVVVLHGLWDGLPSVLAQVVRADFDIFLAEMSIGAIGLVILWRRWQEAVRRQDTQLAETQAP
jgi:hypothetical protein